MEHLRGQIALSSAAPATPPGCCSARPGASSRSTPPWRARRTWRRSGPRYGPATWTAPAALREAAEAARAAPPGPDPPRAVDVLLDAFALRLTKGYAAAAPTLTRALELVLALDAGTDRSRPLALARRSGEPASMVALELWDDESWHALAARQAQVARDTGALVHLQFALNFLAAPTCSPAS